ncbi:MAG: gamma-butyrobetaine hydroxylase-like domain-containing protein [Opitutales bacterium]
MEAAPEDIQLIGAEVAIRWPDGTEHYLTGPFLRAHSPSAENVGEVDILGVRHGGTEKTAEDFAQVTVANWTRIGNYAVAFAFSDGHRTGIYSWPYLRKLGEQAGEA